MDLDIVRRANIDVRKRRPPFPTDKICDVFIAGELVEIGFLHGRCRRDQQGACLMCDYGAARNDVSVETYIREMGCILNELGSARQILLLCTNGSFFDERQISPELFQAVLRRAAQSDFPIVEIETHYQDITDEKLRMVKEILAEKRVMIEMGLETARPNYHDRLIMKGVDLAEYERTLTLIRKYKFPVDTNIMVGLPFLSPKEQFEDAVNTIRWSFAHQCRPVLFPVNIKPYTLLMEAYHAGLCRPPSQWLLPLVLETLPTEQLGQVSVAWFGNREQIYDAAGERTVFPEGCPVCNTAIYHLFQAYMDIWSGERRKAMLNRLLEESTCDCLKTARREIKRPEADSFDTRYAAFLYWLAHR